MHWNLHLPPPILTDARLDQLTLGLRQIVLDTAV